MKNFYNRRNPKSKDPHYIKPRIAQNYENDNYQMKSETVDEEEYLFAAEDEEVEALLLIEEKEKEEDINKTTADEKNKRSIKEQLINQRFLIKSFVLYAIFV